MKFPIGELDIYIIQSKEKNLQGHIYSTISQQEGFLKKTNFFDFIMNWKSYNYYSEGL